MTFKKNLPGCNNSNACGCTCAVCSGANCSLTKIRGNFANTQGYAPGALVLLDQSASNPNIAFFYAVSVDGVTIPTTGCKIRIYVGWADENNTLFYEIEYGVNTESTTKVTLFKRIAGATTQLAKSTVIGTTAISGNISLGIGHLNSTLIDFWDTTVLEPFLGGKVAYEVLSVPPGTSGVVFTTNNYTKGGFPGELTCPVVSDGCGPYLSLNRPPVSGLSPLSFNPSTDATYKNFGKVISGVWSGQRGGSQGFGDLTSWVRTVDANAWIRSTNPNIFGKTGGLFTAGLSLGGEVNGILVPRTISLYGIQAKIGWNVIGDEQPSDYLLITIDSTNNTTFTFTNDFRFTIKYDLYVGGALVASSTSLPNYTYPTSGGSVVSGNYATLPGMVVRVCIGEGTIRVSSDTQGTTLIQYAHSYPIVTSGPFWGVGTGNNPGALPVYFIQGSGIGSVAGPTLSCDGDDLSQFLAISPKIVTRCHASKTLWSNAVTSLGVPYVSTIRATISGLACFNSPCKQTGNSTSAVYDCTQFNGVFDLAPNFSASSSDTFVAGALSNPINGWWNKTLPIIDPQPNGNGSLPAPSLWRLGFNAGINPRLVLYYAPFYGNGPALSYQYTGTLSCTSPFGPITLTFVPNASGGQNTDDHTLCNGATATVTLEGIA